MKWVNGKKQSRTTDVVGTMSGLINLTKVMVIISRPECRFYSRSISQERNSKNSLGQISAGSSFLCLHPETLFIREEIRGEIARTYLYMDSVYPGRGIISKKNRNPCETYTHYSLFPSSVFSTKKNKVLKYFDIGLLFTIIRD